MTQPGATPTEQQNRLRVCPKHPGTCALFEAAGWCAHTQEFDRIAWRSDRWASRQRFGSPSDATADRHWLVEAMRALLNEGEAPS